MGENKKLAILKEKLSEEQEKGHRERLRQRFLSTCWRSIEEEIKTMSFWNCCLHIQLLEKIAEELQKIY